MVAVLGLWRRANILGATIIVRRMPFQDAALTSRSIIINTRYNPGDYEITKFEESREKFARIAQKAKLENETSERTRNNWQPLQAIAKHFKDKEWLDYSNSEIEKSIKSFVGGQHFELEDALLIVLREEMFEKIKRGKVIIEKDVPLSRIRDALKSNFDIYLKNRQIQTAYEALGFKVVSHSNYPMVKRDGKLLRKLLKERGI